MKRKSLEVFKRILYCFSLIGLISSCARVTTLNLEEHAYNKKPGRIVWLQVAGLSEEHLALLRFQYSSVENKTSLESLNCLGKSWSFNLYDIRPSAENSFWSQLTGKSNIKNTCDDFKETPIWSYLAKNKIDSAILQNGMSKGLDEKAAACGPKVAKNLLGNTILWKMQSVPDSVKNPLMFHVHDEKQVYQVGQVYYDKACQDQKCYGSFAKNVENLFQRFEKGRPSYFFLIQDFSYLNALQSKNIFQIKEVLSEIEKIYAFFSAEVQKEQDMLLLVTSAEVMNMEFPASGKEWAAFESKGSNVLFKRASLMSPVFARGARAENLCGIYQDTDIFKRIMFSLGEAQ